MLTTLDCAKFIVEPVLITTSELAGKVADCKVSVEVFNTFIFAPPVNARVALVVKLIPVTPSPTFRIEPVPPMVKLELSVADVLLTRLKIC